MKQINISDVFNGDGAYDTTPNASVSFLKAEAAKSGKDYFKLPNGGVCDGTTGEVIGSVSRNHVVNETIELVKDTPAP